MTGGIFFEGAKVVRVWFIIQAALLLNVSIVKKSGVLKKFPGLLSEDENSVHSVPPFFSLSIFSFPSER